MNCDLTKGFQPGHPRYGGRRPGSVNKRTAFARDLVTSLEEELGRKVDPLETLLRIGADSNQPVDVRLDCAKACLPYLYPRLQSTALTNASGDGPLELGIDFAALMADPKLVQAAQDLALAIAAAEQEQAEVAE